MRVFARIVFFLMLAASVAGTFFPEFDARLVRAEINAWHLFGLLSTVILVSEKLWRPPEHQGSEELPVPVKKKAARKKSRRRG